MQILKRCLFCTLSEYKQVWNFVPTLLLIRELKQGEWEYIVAFKFICLHIGIKFKFGG